MNRKTDNASIPEPTLTNFRRARWKHYMRFIFVGIIVFLFVELIFCTYNIHIVRHESFKLKEIFAYGLAMIMVLPFLPTLVFEVDELDIRASGISVKNLLYRVEESWEDLISLKNPIFLKFAILKGKKGLYFLNKRDLPEFDELIETIRNKAINIIRK